MEQYKTDMSVDEVNNQTAQSRLIRVPEQSATQKACTECLHRVLAQLAGKQCQHGVPGRVHAQPFTRNLMQS